MSDDRLLHGIGVSSGVAVGQAVVVQFELPDVPLRVVPPAKVEREVTRLRESVGAVRKHLEHLRRRTEERVGKEEAKIFDAQLLMLEDREFLKAVEGLIRENQLSAERAYEFKALEVRAHGPGARAKPSVTAWPTCPASRSRCSETCSAFRSTSCSAVRRVMEAGHRVHRELTPGLTVQVEGEKVAGFVSEEGTRTSHAAILARSLGIRA